jgi:hypothetical protein
MKKAIVLFNGSQIYNLGPDLTAGQIAAGFGITNPSLYSEFDSEEFDASCYNFPSAFTLAEEVVGFDLAKAKQIAEGIVNAQSNETAKKTLEGLSYDVYVAQCALPPEQRVVKYQAAIDANNAIALETEQREQAIYAATTIEEVNAVVYPPAAS